METNLEKKIILTGKKVLLDESEAIKSLINTINDDFILCINEILKSPGRLIITGIGKSAIIAQKIVATLNSTGQKSVFMHAADAIHGDLGIIDNQDIIICISKSGDTPEIKALVPLIKNLGNKLIALVSNIDSYLAKHSDHVLNASIEREACPLNLAPTTSTTVALAVGDALAMCLLEARNFSDQDFAKFHPGGSLGKKLYLKVGDLYKNNAIPTCKENAKIREVILEISSKRLGATAVVNDSKELIGIITDGDLRRMLDKYEDFSHLIAKDIMNSNPVTIESSEFAVNAMYTMKEKSITQLVVIDNKIVLGFVHLHDLLKEGLV